MLNLLLQIQRPNACINLKRIEAGGFANRSCCTGYAIHSAWHDKDLGHEEEN